MLRERKEILSEQLVFKHLDASLGFVGLPQSATGQTTLLTGKNGAELMGRHYGPWPGPTLRASLDEGSLFSEVLTAGKTAHFANVFPPDYFRAIKNGKRKVNVPVYAALGAGLKLLDPEDYRQNLAISADLSGSYLHQLDTDLPIHRPAEAGTILAKIAFRQDFSFFDFWLSDTAGHRWSLADSVDLLSQIDAFLSGLIPALNDTTLLISSDHGNIEDKSVKTHTHNAVPMIAIGPQAKSFAGATSLLDIAPAMRSSLSLPNEVGG